MHVSQLKESKYLKKEDCEPAILVTIKELRQENVAKEDDPEELKWCLYFYELEKPLVLNPTNGVLIASILKSEETDDWMGKQIVLYCDPTIMYKGQVRGGIRVRASRRPQPATAAPRPAPAPAPVRPAVPNPAAPLPTSEEEPEAGGDDVPF